MGNGAVRPDLPTIGEQIDARVDLLARPEDDRLLARLRMRLQAARFTSAEIQDDDLIAIEAERVLARIREEQEPYGHWRRISMPGDLSAERFRVAPVDPEVAEVLHRSFHYIGTSREGLALGLFDRRSDGAPPATLLTFSLFDLDHLTALLPIGLQPPEVLVLSRAYSFRWAPRNAFSYAFRRALTHLTEAAGGVRLVLTYVNPNMGFTGASYLASNWLDFAREPELRYDYLDGVYTTRRELARRFGTANLLRLRAALGPRLTTSIQPLAPLEVLAYPATAQLRSRLLEDRGATGTAAAPSR